MRRRCEPRIERWFLRADTRWGLGVSCWRVCHVVPRWYVNGIVIGGRLRLLIIKWCIISDYYFVGYFIYHGDISYITEWKCIYYIACWEIDFLAIFEMHQHFIFGMPRSLSLLVAEDYYHSDSYTDRIDTKSSFWYEWFTPANFSQNRTACTSPIRLTLMPAQVWQYQ